ncbi:hypothetical protein HERIO_153 [Hepatospora eriocheir]|uniref:Protein YIP n=1 Tax=Hepatospora eriocheir TaxID=1081669 RepID=A0A1X0QE30_9MICR|nr:hypothetical protein HERIO_153 [Hepatospora eriocheir]
MESYKIHNEEEIDYQSAFTGYQEGDEPLLKELGIDFSVIKTESLLVFKGLNSSSTADALNSNDIIGPLLYILAYSFILTLNWKIHFSSIYLVSVLFYTFTYILLFLINTSTNHIQLTQCINVIGYCFLPIVLFTFLKTALFFLPKKLLIIVGITASLWSAFVSAQVFCRLLKLSDKTLIITYPLFIGYLYYVIIAVY